MTEKCSKSISDKRRLRKAFVQFMVNLAMLSILLAACLQLIDILYKHYPDGAFLGSLLLFIAFDKIASRITGQPGGFEIAVRLIRPYLEGLFLIFRDWRR